MSDGGRAVVCYVLQAALADSCSSSPTGLMKLFWEYRAVIEKAASAKFDAGVVAADGSVIVDTRDLKSAAYRRR